MLIRNRTNISRLRTELTAQRNLPAQQTHSVTITSGNQIIVFIFVCLRAQKLHHSEGGESLEFSAPKDGGNGLLDIFQGEIDKYLTD